MKIRQIKKQFRIALKDYPESKVNVRKKNGKVIIKVKYTNKYGYDTEIENEINGAFFKLPQILTHND
jgi:hypothetical protein